MSLKIGDRAPNFDVTSHDGRQIRLSELLGKKSIVLYFYPKDFTPVCTKEACGFRDMFESLTSMGAEVIGVSVDTDKTHREFAERYSVPFALIADPQLTLARSFGATSFLGGLMNKAQRVTYVIDKQGRIAGVFDSILFASQHLEGVRATLAALGRGI